ncbi:HAD-IB family hydrolase [Corynebacterium sp. ES2794-CONJ1]|uniref:HAD family hydrolase n=1 Tax=Corynebacterium sp. ES2794-CONJ1 TaxID=2980553 RepID=UPI0021D8963D|nr:HAD family hydrolase [Corynebacterium sp. ES2794-CONJ1]MCU9519594.1 HAD-IB family hydrolase [Corynebacterium sp. ES2794-CONJ1]
MRVPDSSPSAAIPNALEQDAMHTTIGAFFDLDKTIIATSSAHAYGKEFLSSGLISVPKAARLSLQKVLYLWDGLSRDQLHRTRNQLASMISGWEVGEVERIVEESFHTVLCPTIYAEARELIRWHRNQGHRVVIISASADILVRPIAHELGIDDIIATQLAQENGCFTGEILFFCQGEAKADALHRCAEQFRLDLSQSFAYSDSSTDVPMLEKVAHPVAVNPDRALLATARDRGWTIQYFYHPIPLIPRPSFKELTVGTGVIAGLAAATIGVRWWLGRHN